MALNVFTKKWMDTVHWVPFINKESNLLPGLRHETRNLPSSFTQSLNASNGLCKNLYLKECLFLLDRQLILSHGHVVSSQTCSLYLWSRTPSVVRRRKRPGDDCFCMLVRLCQSILTCSGSTSNTQSIVDCLISISHHIPSYNYQ